jgi:hypothetical protein
VSFLATAVFNPWLNFQLPRRIPVRISIHERSHGASKIPLP